MIVILVQSCENDNTDRNKYYEGNFIDGKYDRNFGVKSCESEGASFIAFTALCRLKLHLLGVRFIGFKVFNGFFL